MRPAFEDGIISDFERKINEPRLMALLPKDKTVRRIAILGSGPVRPTDMRNQYPGAEIVCFDFPEMLPEASPDDPHLKTAAWGPLENLEKNELSALANEYGAFDLVFMKMLAHCVDHYDLSLVVKSLRAKRGIVALSIPHPDATVRHLGLQSRHQYLKYVRTIGETGVAATMIYQPKGDWIDSDIATSLPYNYRRVIDEPSDETGKRRLNILYRPPTPRELASDALRSLVKLPIKRRIWVNLGKAAGV